MSATVRAALISIFLVAIGLAAVHLEVEQTRRGVHLRELLKARDTSLEAIRRLETRYNRLVSPDLLEKRLPEDFGLTEEEAQKEEPGVRAAQKAQPAQTEGRGAEAGRVAEAREAPLRGNRAAPE